MAFTTSKQSTFVKESGIDTDFTVVMSEIPEDISIEDWKTLIEKYNAKLSDKPDNARYNNVVNQQHGLIAYFEVIHIDYDGDRTYSLVIKPILGDISFFDNVLHNEKYVVCPFITYSSSSYTTVFPDAMSDDATCIILRKPSAINYFTIRIE